MKPKEDSPQSVLKPCPFCGLHVELVSAKTYPNGERSPSYIKCKRCNYHIAGYEDKDVISQWNTRSAIRKEFCPNCEAETPCTHEAELFVCDICGEDFAKYIVSRNFNVSDVSTTQDVLTSIKTSNSIENNNPDYYKDDVGKWIPIASGRLPEKFQECIVLDKNNRVHNWIHDDVLLPIFAQYTHWMPLPEPPEVKE
jgi:Lar family restriction alleviation protein